jgi:hypothetical protein
MGRWFALLLIVLGVVLIGVGLFNLEMLLGATLEGQRAHLAPSLFPAVSGFWSFVLGIYGLAR